MCGSYFTSFYRSDEDIGLKGETGLAILNLLIGWILGVMSPLAVEKIQTLPKRRAFKRTLSIELEELQFKLAGVVQSLSTKNGTYDRNFLLWFLAIAKKYKGTHPTKRVIESFETLVKGTDQEILAVSQHIKSREEKEGVSFKKYSLLFLYPNLSSLSLCESDFQREVLEIMTQINIINEEMEQSLKYQEKTYDASLTPENYQIIVNNNKQCYVNIEGLAKRLADRIGKIIS